MNDLLEWCEYSLREDMVTERSNSKCADCVGGSCEDCLEGKDNDEE